MTFPAPNRKIDYETVLRRARDLPSLPDVVNRIVDLLGAPNTPASKIAQLVSYDPGLTSKFLRMVNSAAYGFQRQISSVQHAVMLLGFNTVRGIVLSASIFKLFDAKRHHNMDPQAFWRHSIETAIGSRIIANHLNIRYAEDAFSAGMLHDIGKMMLDYYFTAEYGRALEEARLKQVPYHGDAFWALEQDVLDINHAALGYQLALRWKLPATFAEVIKHHHSPQYASDAPELVYAVALANAFSHLIHDNFGVFNSELIPPIVLEYYQFDPENPAMLEALFHKVCSEMDGVQDLLQSLN